jgi:hypothetical protein
MAENQTFIRYFPDIRGNAVNIFGNGTLDYIRVSVKTKILSRIGPPVKGIAVFFDIGEYGFVIRVGVHIGIVAGRVIRIEKPDGKPVCFLIGEEPQ